MDQKGVMKDNQLGWHFARLFFFFLVAFILAFPLSQSVYAVLYPYLASLEPVFKANFTEGSLAEFVGVVIYLACAYFIFSLCYFIESMMEWVITSSAKQGK